MKGLILGALVGVIVVACVGGQDGNEPTTATPTQPTAAAPTATPQGEADLETIKAHFVTSSGDVSDILTRSTDAAMNVDIAGVNDAAHELQGWAKTETTWIGTTIWPTCLSDLKGRWSKAVDLFGVAGTYAVEATKETFDGDLMSKSADAISDGGQIVTDLTGDLTAIWAGCD